MNDINQYKGPERRMNDERIIRLEGRIDGHELLCAERYRNLETSINNSQKSVDKINSMIWWAIGTIMVGLVTGFYSLFIQLHSVIKQ